MITFALPIIYSMAIDSISQKARGKKLMLSDELTEHF